ncbi:glycosyltransferase family 2 protein [Streptomyces sp. NPDC059874]|uniref:glycosyltransferase family 2 protein n=1 Tax=Streptomyces sp. NPDC059874 TaxID=3346983 RepID=UPI0036631C0F
MHDAAAPARDEATQPVPVLSVVIPIYNEQEALPLTVARLRPILDGMGVSYEVVGIDDGSTDATPVIMQKIRQDWPELRIVRFARNSGHQAALTAGIHRALGDYVVSIDADLQDPPEKIAEMYALAREKDLDIVYGVRGDRGTDTFFKRRTAGAYYWLMRKLVGKNMPNQAGDFRLLSRAAVNALKSLPEHQPVYRLLVPWLGFSSGEVVYVREERVAGSTHYPLSKMIRLALDSITNFSASPLRLATWLGLTSFVICFGLAIYTTIQYALGATVPGWASLFIGMVFLGGVQLVCVGLLGEYIGRIYSAVQARPAYFVGYDSADEDAVARGERNPEHAA